MLLLWVSVVVFAAAVYGFFILPTQWLKIERVNIPIGLGKRIVQVSDIHVERLRVHPDRLVRIIRKESPDLIFLTGDFTRKVRYLPRVEYFLKSIISIGVPVYAVLGNHDYKLKGAVVRLMELMSHHGIKLLLNESVDAGGFRLVGIDDYVTKHSRIGRAFQGVGKHETVVVITHDPNVVPEIQQRYDYLMAGHLHGKQFNVPFFFKLKVKGVLPARGIFKGLHKSPQGMFYISKGIGQAGINARLFVRSEITVHDV